VAVVERAGAAEKVQVSSAVLVVEPAAYGPVEHRRPVPTVTAHGGLACLEDVLGWYAHYLAEGLCWALILGAIAYEPGEVRFRFLAEAPGQVMKTLALGSPGRRQSELFQGHELVRSCEHGYPVMMDIETYEPPEVRALGSLVDLTAGGLPTGFKTTSPVSDFFTPGGEPTHFGS
jgi:hypothetical protein